MTLADLLDAIGQKPGVILAAFGGGIVRIAIPGIANKEPSHPWWITASNALLSVVGGTVTAVYLGPLGPSYLGWPVSGGASLATTFLCGVFAMEILKRIGDAITRWTPALNSKRTTNGSPDA